MARSVPGMSPRVVAVDVGSVRKNFAWAGMDLPGRRPVGEGGRHPEGAALAILEALDDIVPVALGFEAPLMVPVSPVGPVDGWMTLGQARHGETVDGRSRPWSAGAGSGALATGLAQLAWVLEVGHPAHGQGRDRVPGVREPQRRPRAEDPLLRGPAGLLELLAAVRPGGLEAAGHVAVPRRRTERVDVAAEPHFACHEQLVSSPS